MTTVEGAERPLRLFVALTPDQAVRTTLHDALAPLRQEVPPRAVSWVSPANLHLTLRFLGEQPGDRVAPLVDALRSLAAPYEPITLRFGGLGAFPAWRRPAVLWIGVEANVALALLYQKVDDVCASLGYGREARAFHPHVTIGRLRRGARLPAPLAERLASDPSSDTLHTLVDSVDLMSSELAPGGARYRALTRARLAGGDV